MKNKIQKSVFAISLIVLSVVGMVGSVYAHEFIKTDSAELDSNSKAMYSNGSAYCCDGSGSGCSAADC